MHEEVKRRGGALAGQLPPPRPAHRRLRAGPRPPGRRRGPSPPRRRARRWPRTRSPRTCLPGPTGPPAAQSGAGARVRQGLFTAWGGKAGGHGWRTVRASAAPAAAAPSLPPGTALMMPVRAAQAFCCVSQRGVRQGLRRCVGGQDGGGAAQVSACEGGRLGGHGARCTMDLTLRAGVLEATSFTTGSTCGGGGPLSCRRHVR